MRKLLRRWKWFDRTFYSEHINCKDPYCLDKMDFEEWDRMWMGIDMKDMPEGYSPCCSICGCCPCGSWRCWECRGNKTPFRQLGKIAWILWGRRQWNKYLESIKRENNHRIAFGPATFARFGLWSKTFCKIGLHRWDSFPKGLRICKECDRWDG